MQLYSVQLHFILLHMFAPKLENKNIVFHSDNMAVVDILKAQSSKSCEIMKLLRPMILLMLKYKEWSTPDSNVPEHGRQLEIMFSDLLNTKKDWKKGTICSAVKERASPVAMKLLKFWQMNLEILPVTWSQQNLALRS